MVEVGFVSMGGMVFARVIRVVYDSGTLSMYLGEMNHSVRRSSLVETRQHTYSLLPRTPLRIHLVTNLHILYHCTSAIPVSESGTLSGVAGCLP